MILQLLTELSQQIISNFWTQKLPKTRKVIKTVTIIILISNYFLKQ